MILRPWEKAVTLNFDPTTIHIRQLRYKDWQDTTKTLDSVENKCCAEFAIQSYLAGTFPSLSDLCFPDPQHFVSGQIHEHRHEWCKVITDDDLREEILCWVTEGVDVNRYIKPFKGVFWGQAYDHAFPPPRVFNNANKCKDFIPFINDTIQERLLNGSISYAGKVGTDPPPYIVAPLTVAPDKPRLCINMMYLNNWTIDRTFKLDSLKDVSKITKQDAYFTSLDDKSGYDNVRTNSRCHHLLGFQWAGHYFVAKTLPFGYKLSAFIYHNLNLQPVSYIRRTFNIPIFLYIDDRLSEELHDSRVAPGYNSALLANYITCEILLRLGFCINLKKSVFVPTQTPTFLGFIVDSVHRCFRLTQEKRSKFIDLREFCLEHEYLSVSVLQRLAGRIVSLMLAIPAAKLFAREINRSISIAIKSGGAVTMSLELKEEILYWRFLDNWQGMLKWKNEKHMVVSLSTDASLHKWGGRVTLPDGDVEVSDFWPADMRHLPIMVLEAHALHRVLKSFAQRLKSSRVDANVDNTCLIAAWNNEGCRSQEMNIAIKNIFFLTLEFDMVLNLLYIPSSENPADAPSRIIKKSDAMLCEVSWHMIQDFFGGESGHTFDLMALDSNCMKDREGRNLPHFTPYPTPESAGVNMFSQDISTKDNFYVFPPFNLTHAVLNFIVSSTATCSVVLKCGNVTPVWFPALQENISDALLIGLKGQRDCLMFPSKLGFVRDRKGLADNLWAIRLEPHVGNMSYGKLMFSKHPNVGVSNKLLCIGDSIVRGMGIEKQLHNPLVLISSFGGATVGNIVKILPSLVQQHKPFIIFIHCGVNNLSKTYKYLSEFHQMSCASHELMMLENTLKTVISVHCCPRVIFSECLITRNPDINARATLFNAGLSDMCKRNAWESVKHTNIREEQLRDDVHLKPEGRALFVENIMAAVQSVI